MGLLLTCSSWILRGLHHLASAVAKFPASICCPYIHVRKRWVSRLGNRRRKRCESGIDSSRKWLLSTRYLWCVDGRRGSDIIGSMYVRRRVFSPFATRYPERYVCGGTKRGACHSLGPQVSDEVTDLISLLGQIWAAVASLLAVWHWDSSNTGGGRVTKW